MPGSPEHHIGRAANARAMTEADDRTRRAGGEDARTGAVLHFGAHALLEFGDLAAQLADMVSPARGSARSREGRCPRPICAPLRAAARRGAWSSGGNRRVCARARRGRAGRTAAESAGAFPTSSAATAIAKIGASSSMSRRHVLTSVRSGSSRAPSPSGRREGSPWARVRGSARSASRAASSRCDGTATWTSARRSPVPLAL